MNSEKGQKTDLADKEVKSEVDHGPTLQTNDEEDVQFLKSIKTKQAKQNIQIILPIGQQMPQTTAILTQHSNSIKIAPQTAVKIIPQKMTTNPVKIATNPVNIKTSQSKFPQTVLTPVKIQPINLVGPNSVQPITIITPKNEKVVKYLMITERVVKIHKVLASGETVPVSEKLLDRQMVELNSDQELGKDQQPVVIQTESIPNLNQNQINTATKMTTQERQGSKTLLTNLLTNSKSVNSKGSDTSDDCIIIEEKSESTKKRKIDTLSLNLPEIDLEPTNKKINLENEASNNKLIIDTDSGSENGKNVDLDIKNEILGSEKPAISNMEQLKNIVKSEKVADPLEEWKQRFRSLENQKLSEKLNLNQDNLALIENYEKGDTGFADSGYNTINSTVETVNSTVESLRTIGNSIENTNQQLDSDSFRVKTESEKLDPDLESMRKMLEEQFENQSKSQLTASLMKILSPKTTISTNSENLNKKATLNSAFKFNFEEDDKSIFRNSCPAVLPNHNFGEPRQSPPSLKLPDFLKNLASTSASSSKTSPLSSLPTLDSALIRLPSPPGTFNLSSKSSFKCTFTDPETSILCGQEFTRSDDLARHYSKHNPEKLKVCPFPGCNYRCNRKDNMECHMRTHSGAKPYVCPYVVLNEATGEEKACGYAAVRQDDWTKHCMKIHLEKVPESTLNPDKETWHRTKNQLVIKKYNYKHLHKRMDSCMYQQMLQRSPTFMKYLSLRIMKKWNAVYHRAKKIKNTKMEQFIINIHENGKPMPNLRHHAAKYERSKLEKITSENKDDLEQIFVNPGVQFCDIELNLEGFDFGTLLDGYVAGKKIHDEFA